MQGALLAEELGQECEHCQQADQILCLLSNNFWNETGGYITADINVNNVNRSGINADPLLAAITNFDYNATCDSGESKALFIQSTLPIPCSHFWSYCIN